MIFFRVFLFLVVYLMSFILFNKVGDISLVNKLLLVPFSLGIFVRGYRYFILGSWIFISLFFLMDFHVLKIMGFHFFDILPDLYAISLDSNPGEVWATAQNINSKNEILSVILLIFVCLSFYFTRKLNSRYAKLLIVISLSSFVILSISNNFIFHKIYLGLKNTVNLIDQNKDRIQEKESFKWDAISNYNEKDTVVLVLGETTRGDRLGINGYHRDTTPNLDKREIITYSDVISNAAYTLLSTPIILTRSFGEINSKVFPEKSLISAFKEAGYKTYYVTYLNKIHIGDNAINQLVAEADIYLKGDLSLDSLEDIAGAYDVLKILKEPEEKKLIVFKLIGSHYNFHERYDDRFNKFTPSYLDTRYSGPKLEEKQLLENSYDNSILVTDYAVDLIIEGLSKVEGRSSLSFISDHGISIFDIESSPYGGPTKSNYNIPLFFWFKDGYFSSEKLSNLEKNSDTSVDSTCFLDTFFTLHDLETPKKKGCDLANSVIRPYPRKVIVKDQMVDYELFFKGN